MTIEVKFFASLREKTGKADLRMELSGPLNVEQVWRQATENMTMPDNTLCAVNMEYVDKNHPVAEGDEVAFFPPVTGG